jgi:putative ABC transport system substrate-binding protein
VGVSEKANVILADSTPSVTALVHETQSIPIVFITVNDPIASGFAQSFARPGGSITGFANFEFSMGGKWLDLLKKIAPRVIRVAVLFNPTTAPFFDRYLRAAAAAAPSYGIVPVPTPVREAADFDRTIAAFARESNSDGGLLIISDSFLFVHRDRIVALAAQHSLPAVYAGSKAFFTSGGLISYGDDYVDQLHGAASYVDRILRGEKPGDLPVQTPTKFLLYINLKTAKALGLEVPPSLLALANEVVE